MTGAILGQHKLTKPQAAAAAKLFGLSKSEQTLINEVPMRGTGTPMPPTDPLIYRFYELILVNGPALKVLIEEEFGDGIMSAIDFDMDITRKTDPKGDRVQIGMTGKFLPFKYYGATGNAVGVWVEGGVIKGPGFYFAPSEVLIPFAEHAVSLHSPHEIHRLPLLRSLDPVTAVGNAVGIRRAVAID